MLQSAKQNMTHVTGRYTESLKLPNKIDWFYF